MNVTIPTEMKYVQYIKYRHAAAIFNRTTNLARVYMGANTYVG